MSRFKKTIDDLMSNDIQVIPVNQNKTPALPSWKKFIGLERVNYDIKKYFKSHTEGIALLCGKSSKNIEVLDIDIKYFGDYMKIEEFDELLNNTDSELLKKLVIQKTQNNGLHLIYRCDTIEGSKKLASRKITSEELKLDPKQKVKVLFETKGERGYVLTAPTKGYEIIHGSLESIPLITSEERDILLNCARSFNETEPVNFIKSKDTNNSKSSVDVFGDYQSKVSVWDILNKEGYMIVYETEKRITIKRSGSEAKHSGYIHKDNDVLVMFSSSTEFEPERGYNSAQVYTQIHHDGDLSEASKSLYNQGFGMKTVQNAQMMNTFLDTLKPYSIVESEENGQNGHFPIEFPIDVFPVEIIEVINEAKDKLKYPIEFISSAILGASSVSIGATREVQVAKGWQMNCVLYILIVGAPGVCKTHPINFALKPIKDVDSKMYKSYCRDLEDFNRKSTKEQKISSPPIFNQIIVKDATPEALLDVLNKNERGVIFHKDELIALIKDFTRYKASGSEQEFWLSNWSNDSISINRKSSVPLRIDKSFVTLLGTMQPSVLKSLLAGMDNNGFIDRFLISYPDNLKSEKFSEEEMSQDVIDNYFKAIKKLQSFDFEYGNQPKVLRFDLSAKKLWKEWYNELADKKNNTTSERLKSIYSKLDNMVPRIALILECLHKDSNEISRNSLLNAIRVGEYYLQNTKKVLCMEKLDLSDKPKACKELKEMGKTNKEIQKILKIKSRSTISKYSKQ